MSQTIAAQIAELRNMSVSELKEKYREVCGREARSGNKDWLWKRIAWRIQEQEFGGVPEHVKERAARIVSECNPELRVSKGASAGPEKAPNTVQGNVSELASHDSRLPAPGTLLTRKYKGETYYVKVLNNGFEFEGMMYKSLSAVAREITGSHWNGFLFFNLKGANGQ